MDSDNTREDQPAGCSKTLFYIFGVVVPLTTLLVEVIWGLSGEAYFDPLPTLWHIGLVGAAPLIIALSTKRLCGPQVDRLAEQQFALSFAIGVSAIYAIPYLPLAPFALLGTPVLIGFLPLAPILAAILAIALFRLASRRQRYRDAMAEEPIGAIRTPGRRLALGLLAALLVTEALALPSTIPSAGVLLADSENELSQTVGLELMRLGETDETLAELSESPRRPYPSALNYLLVLPDQPDNSTFNGISYLALGEPPRQPLGPDQERPLALSESRFSGHIDRGRAAGLVDWKFTFANRTRVRQEARMEVQLPPGATVSDVTLWIEGEPRQAAVDEEEKVEEAYDTIVSRQRDPILVRSIGPDRVEIRAFPVPPSGEMTARLSLDIPLAPGFSTDADLRLPRLLSRNFADVTAHQVQLECDDAEIAPSGFPGQHLIEESHEIDTTVGTASLHLFRAGVDRPTGRVGEPYSGSVEQLDRLVWVIDGSSRMSEHAPALVAALEHLPEDIEVSLYIATDTPGETLEDRPVAEGRWQLRKWLEDVDFEGGVDNIPALEAAFRHASRLENAAVVWVHGPQPIEFADADRLERAIGEADRTPTIFELQVAHGVDSTLDALEKTGVFAAVPRYSDDTRQDLERWFHALDAAGGWHAPAAAASTEALNASAEVTRLLRQGRVDEATEVAKRHRIVTPVTGSVVLESAAQYREFDLATPAFTSATATPEPETWAMIIMVVVAAGVGLRRRRVAA